MPSNRRKQESGNFECKNLRLVALISLAGNRIRNKKIEGKALIPLPPTGSTSVFCANPDAMKALPQPRPAVGLRRGAAIAQRASLCRKMSAPYTVSDGAVQMVANLRGPAHLGEKLEKRGGGWFSKSTPVLKRRIRASIARSGQTSTTHAGRGL